MSNDINVNPLFDRVLIKRIDERTTDGGIVIPETIVDKSQRGVVIAVGPGKLIDGKNQQPALKCNDVVIFNKYSGTDIVIKGKEYLIIKEDDVLAVIN